MDTFTHKTLTQLGKELADSYEQFEQAYRAFAYRIKTIYVEHPCPTAKATAVYAHQVLTVGLGGIVLLDNIFADPTMKAYVPLEHLKPNAENPTRFNPDHN